MRILKIAGKNLASLHEEFVIDFSEPPLSEAGLFVITGATGAGKSTLLDAICLALYNEIPRFSKHTERSRKAIGAYGELIQGNDPRQILRRGEKEGYARVTFVALDGKIYTATWEAHTKRIQKRAAQVIEKSITTNNILKNESDNLYVEISKSTYTQQIEILLGLNYAQFTRAVLLAQGDFAAFLDASTNEKAALLELLTGTEHFAAISRTIHQKTDEIVQAYKQKNEQIRLLGILTPQEYKELEAQTAKKAKEYEQTIQRIHDIQATLLWYKTLEELQTATQKKLERKKHIEAQLAELETERIHIEQWEESRESRTQLVELQKREHLQTEHIEVLRKQSRLLERCEKQLKKALAIKEDLENERKEQIREKSSLDHLVLRVDELEKQKRVLEETRNETEKKLQRLVLDGKRARGDADATLKQVNKVRNEITERDKAIKALTPSFPFFEQLDSVVLTFQDTKALWCELLLLQKAQQAIATDERKLLEDKAQCSKQLETLAGCVSLEVAKLRARLKADEPCPVCGSTTHFASYTEQTDSSTANLDEIDTQRQTLITRLETIDNDLQALQTTLEKNLAKLEYTHSRLVYNIQQLSSVYRNLSISFVIPQLADRIDGQSDEFITQFETQLTSLEQRLAQLAREKELWDKFQRQNGLENELAALYELHKNKEENTKKLRAEYINTHEQTKKIDEAIEQLKQDTIALLRGQKSEELLSAFKSRENRTELAFSKNEEQRKNLASECQKLREVCSAQNSKRKENYLAICTLRSNISHWLTAHPTFSYQSLEALNKKSEDDIRAYRNVRDEAQQELIRVLAIISERETREKEHLATRSQFVSGECDVLQNELTQQKEIADTLQKEFVALSGLCNEQLRKEALRRELEHKLEIGKNEYDTWNTLNELYGSADGRKFRTIAQRYTLAALLFYANQQLESILPRYRLLQGEDLEQGLTLRIVDSQMFDEIRNVDTLSGGEKFIVSLALSLGLSSIAAHSNAIEMLFIDEGFGTLDPEYLNLVLDALTSLENLGRKIGLISHVQELNERIATQIRVVKTNNNSAKIVVVG